MEVGKIHRETGQVVIKFICASIHLHDKENGSLCQHFVLLSHRA